ncbi:unnamed protein product [Mytilus edulis]|uniref:Helitron helicase-like domain-containing protein n=1 Tax=Mytilus edulis TaxID=6550 RepID=A0A8S3QMJ9_MYTED|nr:unnamed protein product [Mytilus edulis]
MKLVQLPKGKQRGIICPCVSIPTDIQKTVTILPQSYDDTQLVRCKLKRKQSYIGYSQYEFISTNKIYKALESLKESNPYYKNTSLNHNWHDEFPPDFEELTVAEEDHKESDDYPKEEDQNVKDRGFPCDTCLQPVDIGQEMLDQHFDDIFCVAPGEGSTPVSMMQEEGTPPYWQSALHDLLATVRQLGIPTWFATFSAADMRWTEVLQLLLEQQESTQSLEDLDWTGKSEVLRNNPVMSAVMFDHRFHTFLREIVIKRRIIGNVKDHFHRIEFQQRGSPHAHCLFWIEDAPKLDKDDDQTVCDFVDRYVSCKLPDKTVDPELHEIVSSVQQHSKNHSKSCLKKGTSCRFNFPRPPSEKTFISRRQSLTDPSIKKSPQQLKDYAQSVLHNLWTVLNNEHLDNITTENLFAAAGITQQEFEDASNILTKRSSVTMKRTPSDSWINQYNPDLLRCWNANMDLQFITDVYACVVYIISYISKAEREMGVVLQNASKEAAEGNCDAQQAMKKIGGAYFRQREVSAQEAVYRVCGLHLKECSRKVQFVPVGDNPVRMSLPLSVIKKKANQLHLDAVFIRQI